MIQPWAFVQDGDFARLNRQMERVVSGLRAIPHLDGIEIEVTFVAGVAQDVAHSLGRAWRGYFVSDNDSQIMVQSDREAADDTLYINLTSSDSFTGKVWVY